MKRQLPTYVEEVMGIEGIPVFQRGVNYLVGMSRPTPSVSGPVQPVGVFLWEDGPPPTIKPMPPLTLRVLGSEAPPRTSSRLGGSLYLPRVLFHGPSILNIMIPFHMDLKAPEANSGVWLNHISDAFSKPLGFVIMREGGETGFFFSHAYIPLHTLSIDVMGVIVCEGLSVQYQDLHTVRLENPVLSLDKE